MGCSFRPDWVAALHRIGWQEAPEYAHNPCVLEQATHELDIEPTLRTTSGHA
jgi:hypothetical protein